MALNYGLDVIIDVIQSYRIAWISGRVGVGKTSLAYLIAEHFLKQDYKLLTNNRSVWADDMDDIKLENGTARTVVILDEGGLVFKNARQVELIASYPAKMDMIYLLPSFWPPSRAAQLVRIHGLYSLRRAGLPWSVYRWSAGSGVFRDTGIAVVDTSPVWGVYDRQDPGDLSDKVMTKCLYLIDEFRAQYGRNTSFDLVDNDESESLAALADVAEMLEASTTRKTKKR